MAGFNKRKSFLKELKVFTKFLVLASVLCFSFFACKAAQVSSSSKSVLVDSITLSGESRVAVGESITLTATILPENATNKNITWTANKYCTYKDNFDGTVTIYGKSVGTGEVSAMAKDGTGSSSLLAISILNRATVNYNDGESTLLSQNSYFVGDVISQNDYVPTKENNVFVAWCKDSSCTTPVTYPYTVESTNTFYNKFKQCDWKRFSQKIYWI